jgi:hypothetical protein
MGSEAIVTETRVRIPFGDSNPCGPRPVSSDHQRGRFHRTVSERETSARPSSCLLRRGSRVTKTVTTGRDSWLSRGPRRRTVSRATPRFFSRRITAQRGIVSFPRWTSPVRFRSPPFDGPTGASPGVRPGSSPPHEASPGHPIHREGRRRREFAATRCMQPRSLAAWSGYGQDREVGAGERCEVP